MTYFFPFLILVWFILSLFLGDKSNPQFHAVFSSVLELKTKKNLLSTFHHSSLFIHLSLSCVEYRKGLQMFTSSPGCIVFSEGKPKNSNFCHCVGHRLKHMWFWGVSCEAWAFASLETVVCSVILCKLWLLGSEAYFRSLCLIPL